MPIPQYQHLGGQYQYLENFSEVLKSLRYSKLVWLNKKLRKVENAIGWNCERLKLHRTKYSETNCKQRTGAKSDVASLIGTHETTKQSSLIWRGSFSNSLPFCLTSLKLRSKSATVWHEEATISSRFTLPSTTHGWKETPRNLGKLVENNWSKILGGKRLEKQLARNSPAENSLQK